MAAYTLDAWLVEHTVEKPLEDTQVRKALADGMEQPHGEVVAVMRLAPSDWVYSRESAAASCAWRA